MKFGHSFTLLSYVWSPPSRGAWIEIVVIGKLFRPVGVAPLAGGVD